jgi:tetratricopeptide (TPR) repeat protein
MINHLDRAHHLIAINRHSEAETEIRKALADDPLDPEALALLSLCRLDSKKYGEAVQLAEQAVAQQPDAPFLYLVLGQAQFYNKNIPKARLAISEGQRLDPSNANFFELRAHIEFYQENWEQALRETERGLELDPENVELVNLRAQTLVNLNRKSDADVTLDYALHKAPENSNSHANKGWVAIEKDRYDEAVKHFLEALRLDPENGYARRGLKEAIKGKNLLYRVILKYFLWMNKLQEKGRWAFVIGMYVLYRAFLSLSKNVPELAPFLYPFIVLYVLFAFSTWIAKPVSNLFLRLHPLGKHALDKDEILGSNIAGALALLSVGGFLAAWLLDAPTGFGIGIVAAVMLIPVGGVFAVPAESGARRSLSGYAILLAVLGLIWLANPAFEWALGVMALGIFLYGWVANYLIGKASKEF